MKKSRQIIVQTILLSILTTVTSCTPPEEKSKTKDGNCTQTYLDSYNAVLGEIKKLSEYKNSSYYTEQAKFNQVQTLDRTCRSFYNDHGNVSCKALVNYSVKYVSGGDFKSVCAQAKEMVENSNPSRKTETPSVDSSGKISSLNPDKVTFMIIDYQALNQVVKSTNRPVEEQQIIVQGRVTNAVASARLIRVGIPYCLISAANRLDWENLNHAGGRVKVANMHEGYRDGVRVLIFKSEQQNVTITCAKTQVSEFTVSEVKNAFEGIFSFFTE